MPCPQLPGTGRGELLALAPLPGLCGTEQSVSSLFRPACRWKSINERFLRAAATVG